jgi:hypothetical protein
MKKLLLVATFLLPAIAQAAPKETILPLAPVRDQIKAQAKSAGLLQAGDKLTVRTIRKPAFNQPGLVKVRITKMMPTLPGTLPTKHTIADAEFKTTSMMDGIVATGVKQNGEIWQRYMFPQNAVGAP